MVSSNTVYVSGFSAGNYDLHIMDSTGCVFDSSLAITEPGEIGLDQAFTICPGDSVVVGTSVYNATGIYNDVYTAINGCDSTVTTDLTVNAVIDNTTTVGGFGNELTANASGLTYQWIVCPAGTPIAGETNQNFVAAGNGTYAVILSDGLCSDTSVCTLLEFEGIFGGHRNNFMVYPNPGKGEFFISLSETADIVVLNSLGQKIQGGTFVGGVQCIDIQTAATGVYYLKVTSSQNQSAIKLIKQ